LNTETEIIKNPPLFWRRNERLLAKICSFIGFDPRRFVMNLAGVPKFIRDAGLYARKSRSHRLRMRLRDLYPILDESRKPAGTVWGHYFHQDLWAARKIFARRPATHIDIGSRIDGFIAHLLPFMAVTVIDLRPMESKISGLNFIQDDATHLCNCSDNSVDSLSSLHAAEHFGLGRYSDPIDPDACFRFMSSLQRVLSPGGRLYFSVPIGRERVDFNAHRVFATSTILSSFSGLSLVSFSCIDDDGDLHEDLLPTGLPQTEYGCGLFEFTKLQPSSAARLGNSGR
jgi:hypothetical protein